jgi:hypothetical protein
VIDAVDEEVGIFEFESAQGIFSGLERQKQAFDGCSLSEKLDIAPISTAGS